MSTTEECAREDRIKDFSAKAIEAAMRETREEHEKWAALLEENARLRLACQELRQVIRELMAKPEHPDDLDTVLAALDRLCHEEHVTAPAQEGEGHS